MFIETKEYQEIEFKYPHIAKKILLNWGSCDMNNYLTNLLLDTRYGARDGFPIEDAENILFILEIHKKEFPWLVNIKENC
jgi:hypothetical protein